MTKARFIALVLLVGGWFSVPVSATVFQITVDLTPLSGQSGFLAFDFTAGLPLVGNFANVIGFASDSALGSSSHSGDVSGNLIPGPLSLGEGQFFSEWLQGINSFGTTASFQLNLGSNNVIGGIPDSFSFFLLDSSQVPIPTSDPTGADALFAIDMTGSSTCRPFTIPTSPLLACDLPAVSVPEPSALLLMIIGLSLILRKRIS